MTGLQQNFLIWSRLVEADLELFEETVEKGINTYETRDAYSNRWCRWWCTGQTWTVAYYQNEQLTATQTDLSLETVVVAIQNYFSQGVVSSV
jgi:hypothetical protein